MRTLINKNSELTLTQIRKLISPSVRFELREIVVWVKEILNRACLWRWEITRLPKRSDRKYEIVYAGRKSHQEFAKVLLGIDGNGNGDATQVVNDISRQTVLVSEAPIPGALKVPSFLRLIIPIEQKTIEVIMGDIEDKLRRIIRNRRGGYHIQQVLDRATLDRAIQELLEPYASARHGASAAQIAPAVIHEIAQNIGRLDLVLKEDEILGCILGCAVTKAKKRYWSLMRCGYSEAVFSDSSRLREANAINFFLALEWAINNGFDYYDMGTCLGRPEDGLFQWKKRWGGLADTMGNHSFYYVRLPRTGAAQFLWDVPLFSSEGKDLTLHLGLPDGKTDEDFSLRYREMNRGMGIGGLFKIYLHCTKLPSEKLIGALSSHYAHQKSPPIVESIVSP